MKLRPLLIVVVFFLGGLTAYFIWHTVHANENLSHVNELKFIPISATSAGLGVEMVLKTQANLLPNIRSFQEIRELLSSNKVDVYKTRKNGDTLSCVFFNMRSSPCDDVAFREAISRLIDREQLAQSLLNNMVIPNYSFVPSTSDEWTSYENMALPVDAEKAKQLLDQAGYVMDKSKEGRINPKTGALIKLSILSPLKDDNVVLWSVGNALNQYCNAVGIKSELVPLESILLTSRTKDSRDFEIYVQEIPLVQAPFELYTLFHSSRNILGSFAYSGTAVPELDANLEILWNSVDYKEIITASQNIQKQLSEIIPYVPVCTTPEISAVQGQWAGIVNMPGLGIRNIWTYVNLHDMEAPAKTTFKQVAVGGFNSLNPLLASTMNEWQVLELVYSPLFYPDALTLKDKPMLAKSWKTDKWKTSSGKEGMKVTFNLRDDVLWHDGVTFTSKDIQFCYDFLKENQVPKYQDTIQLIDHVSVTDKWTISFYFNDPGYRHIYELAWFTILPEHIWKNVTDYKSFRPWEENNSAKSSLTNLVGQGPFIYKKSNVVEEVSLQWNAKYDMY